MLLKHTFKISQILKNGHITEQQSMLLKHGSQKNTLDNILSGLGINNNYTSTKQMQATGIIKLKLAVIK